MPRIIVQLTGRRSVDEKRRLVEAITAAVVGALAVSPQSVTIRIEIAEPEDFARGGRLASDDVAAKTET